MCGQPNSRSTLNGVKFGPIDFNTQAFKFGAKIGTPSWLFSSWGNISGNEPAAHVKERSCQELNLGERDEGREKNTQLLDYPYIFSLNTGYYFTFSAENEWWYMINYAFVHVHKFFSQRQYFDTDTWTPKKKNMIHSGIGSASNPWILLLGLAG